ncbi:MAG: DNA-binding protein WhiA [Clostridia bacterium]|nr:DNA-binding protein WhiA [Clostridia bacterium]
MSFTTDVCEELIRLPLKKTCCRKAFLLGLMLGAGREEEQIHARFYSPSLAELAASLLGRLLRVEAEPTPVLRVGRQTYVLTFRAPAISSFLDAVDRGTEEPVHTAVGFRCASCGAAFLRGAFLGCGTVNDPHKGYHLEFLLPTPERSAFLGGFLQNTVGKPGRVKRGTRFGLYYKSNGAISDLLYLIGCSKTSFDVTNVSIEREIRNNENRATNCVARNISRSVDASQKQRAAIEKLIATRRIDTLPEELRYTARLRLEHASASLLELSLLHDPPISKSGLNRRLTKLMEAAEE